MRKRRRRRSGAQCSDSRRASASVAALSATARGRRAGDPAHRSAHGRARGAQAAPLPRGALRDRADRVVHAARRVPSARSSSARALNYNITDWLGIGVWGALRPSSASTTDLTDKIDSVGAAQHAARRPTLDHTAQPRSARVRQRAVVRRPDRRRSRGSSRRRSRSSRSAASSPSSRRSSSTPTSTSTAGVAFVGVKERGDCGAARAARRAPTRRRSRSQSQTTIAPTFGLGFTFYPANFGRSASSTARSRSRGTAAASTRAARGPNGNFPDNKVNGEDETFKFNQMITIGLGFSFPTTPKISE